MHLFHPFVILALGALLLGAAGPAAAQVKEGQFGAKGQASGALLTREQLRACMAQQARIRHAGDDIARDRAAMDIEKAALVTSGADLRDKLAALDRSSQEAVDAYNAEAAERDKRIDEFEPRLAAFNVRAEALGAERAAFAKACENRRFDERDEIAIRKGK
jgi:hypothetical protein